jgi:hypothetical protein
MSVNARGHSSSKATREIGNGGLKVGGVIPAVEKTGGAPWQRDKGKGMGKMQPQSR